MKEARDSASYLKNGFAASFDGTLLHYSISGNGTPAIVLSNGILVSTFFWKYINRYFRNNHKIVTWDYRGHGSSHSPKNPENASLEAVALDLKAVMDTSQVSKGILIGHSYGVQLIFEFYRRFPERVVGLVPVCGTYGNTFESFLDSPVSKPLVELSLLFAMTRNTQFSKIWKNIAGSEFAYRMALALGLVFGPMIKEEDLRPYFDHLTKVDMKVIPHMAVSMNEHTAEDILSKVKVPTLIIAGEKDLFTPLRTSLHMHEKIKGSEMLVIPKGSHGALIEHPDLINLRLEKFIRDHFGKDLFSSRTKKVKSRSMRKPK